MTKLKIMPNTSKETKMPQCVQTSVMRRIIEIIDEYNFENVNIELEDNLETHLGIDEDMKISLQSDLEDEWCINIPSIDFYNTDTVQDVLDIVRKYVA